VGRAKKYLQLYGTEIKKKPKTQRKVAIVSLKDFKAAEQAGSLKTLKLATKVIAKEADVKM